MCVYPNQRQNCIRNYSGMSKVKLYEKNGRLVIQLPGDVLRIVEQDGDLQALNGTESDEVTVRFTENQENFIFSYDFTKFVGVDGTTQIGSTRDATVTNLNALFDAPPKLRDNLDVNGKTITSASNGNVVIDPDGTGAIRLISDTIEFEGAGVFQGQIKLFESDLTGDNFIALKAPLSVTSDVTLTLPDGAGTSGQVLSSGGVTGVLSWATVLTGTNDTLRGIINIKDTASARGQILFYDDAENNYIAIKAPDALTSNTTYNLPVSDGSNGQFLQTDGSGTLLWATASGGSSSDGWHGHTTKIKVMPSEFMGSDAGRSITQVYIEDDTSNELGARINNVGSCYAFVPIPTGYKATAVRVNTSTTVTNGVTVSHYDITDGSTSNSQTFNTSSTTNLTNQLTSSDNDVLVIKVSLGSTSRDIYGAQVTIASV